MRWASRGAQVNVLNTPSYLGGDMIAKLSAKKLAKRARKLAKQRQQLPAPPSSAQLAVARYQAALSNHNPRGTDPHATAAEITRAGTQLQVEMIKLARAHPIGVGDLGVINMLRGGRP